MSLDYDLTKIQDHKNVCWNPNGKINPITEIIIFMTVGVGIGDLSEENATEFYKRVDIWQRLMSPLLRNNDGTSYYITPEDISDHIGLKTNVFPMETRAQFTNKMWRDIDSKYPKIKIRPPTSVIAIKELEKEVKKDK